MIRLAELGIGTNPMAREIGHVENKFRKGTAHIALGDNHLIGWGAVKSMVGKLSAIGILTWLQITLLFNWMRKLLSSRRDLYAAAFQAEIDCMSFVYSEISN